MKQINRLAILLYLGAFLWVKTLFPFKYDVDAGDKSFFTDTVIVLSDVKLEEVTEADLTLEGGTVVTQDNFFDKGMLRILETNSTTPISMEGTDNDSQNVKFVFERPTVVFGVVSSGGERTITIEKIKIKQKNASDTILSTKAGTFSWKVQFTAGGDTRAEKSEAVIVSRLTAIPTAVPSGFGVGGAGFKTGVAAWSKQGDVLHSNLSSYPPSDMVLLRFGPNEGVAVNIDIVEDINDPSTVVPGTCEYAEADDCLTNCTKTSDNSAVAAGNYFISSEGQNAAIKVDVITNLAEAGSKVYTDLEFGETYRAVLQFKKGLNHTTCLQLEAQDNDTLSELNGDPEAELGDPRCFIVSASYGSPFATQVDLYRWFRDRVLLQSELGIRFVDFYYNHSQPIADVINESPSLQLLMQLLLLVPTSCLYVLHAMGFSFWLCLTILGMAVVCAVSYQLRKKKALSSV